jgi:hypothetical protein
VFDPGSTPAERRADALAEGVIEFDLEDDQHIVAHVRDRDPELDDDPTGTTWSSIVPAAEGRREGVGRSGCAERRS